jgi:hypothetical protein
MSLNLKNVLKYVILATAFVSALGPSVATLAGAAPSKLITVLSGLVAASASIHLFLTESPLVQPLLATKMPEVKS